VRGTEIGRLAASFSPSPKFDDHELLQFIADELALALRCVVLAEETRRIASTDPLTGLHNRRSGLDVLTQSAAASARYGQSLSVALLDLDHFKRVNDTYGHNVGDEALKHVARLLKRATRKADFPMRWGGEEFVLLMPSTGAAGARVCGERIRMAVAAAPLELGDGKTLPLTASIGVATFDGRESETQLIERADKALYAAKERGRNRVEVG
jgi:diguanylate cyclase (GGDEF)-like protein